jgi:hypothetical protein
MTTLHLRGIITEDGRLEVTLPPGTPPGEARVEVTIEQPAEARPWTDEELRALLEHRPKTSAEIAQSDVIGSWSHLGIEHPVAWVEEVRRKEREHRQWSRE